MTYRIRPYKKRGKHGFEVDIVLRLPSGEVIRERVKSPVSSMSGSKAWAQAREAELLLHGKKDKNKTSVPTLDEFAPRFMSAFVVANRQKPSTVESKQAILDGKLLPLLGKRRLDEICDEDVQRIKADLHARKPKTVNNVLTVLSKVLKVAVKWKVIPVMPVQIELLKLDEPEVTFYEFEEYARLVEAAEKVDRRALLTVMLGGDAGLRTGEIVGLEWERHRLSSQPAHRLQVRVEWSRHAPQGRPSTQGADDEEARCHARCPQAPAGSSGSLPGRWDLHLQADVDHLDGGGAAPGRAEADGQQTHASSHLLLAPGDARGDDARHQRAGRAPEHPHHDAVHAPESRPQRAGHRPPRPRQKRDSWRHDGDGELGHRQTGGGRWCSDARNTKGPEGLTRSLRLPGDDQDL